MKSYIFGRLWAFFTHWFNPVFNQVTYLFYHWCEYASLIRSCIVLIKHPSSMTGLDLPCLGQGEKTSTSWPIVSWFPDDDVPKNWSCRSCNSCMSGTCFTRPLEDFFFFVTQKYSTAIGWSADDFIFKLLQFASVPASHPYRRIGR